MYSIQWTKKALKQLCKIQPMKQREAISEAVDTLENNPTINANVKALKGHNVGFRLRVGQYRVLFDLDNGVKIITISEVRKRDERTY